LPVEKLLAKVDYQGVRLGQSLAWHTPFEHQPMVLVESNPILFGTIIASALSACKRAVVG
jgi:hypothetical protein